MSGTDLADKGELLGMPYRLDSQVDIQIRPVEMVRRRQFDVENLPDCNVTKPWKFRKGQKQLLIIQQNPEPVPGDVGYFNGGNVCAKRC
jgi:hypothetical protein